MRLFSRLTLLPLFVVLAGSAAFAANDQNAAKTAPAKPATPAAPAANLPQGLKVPAQAGAKPGAAPNAAPGQAPKAGVSGGPAKPGQPPAKPGAKGGKPAGGGGATGATGPTAPAAGVPPPPNPVTEGFNTPTKAEAEASMELPEAGGSADKKITVLVKQQSLDKVMEKLNKESGISVKAKGTIAEEKIDVSAKNQTLPQILSGIVSGKEWTWIKREDGSYEVWDKASFTEQELKKRVIRRSFRLEHVLATDVQPALDGVKSEIGLVAANPRTNELIVTDLPDKVALIESIIREIDVPLWTRTFRIKYANFDTLQERITNLKSPAGDVQLDAINKVIIVTDTFEKIKEFERLIEILDIDRPMVAYNLTSIGIDSAAAKEMVDKFIKPVTTEDAILEFNEDQGVMLVQDVAEAHEKIRAILKALDHSPKQIWFEGEILEVSEDYKFNFGTEVTYSSDLPAAIIRGLVPGFGQTGTTTTANTTPIATSSSRGLPLVQSGANGLKVLHMEGDLKAQIDALMSDSRSRLLLQPRALVRNGEEVTVDLSQENPQLTTFVNNGFNSVNNGIGGFNSSSITFVPTGLTVTVTPTISNRGLVEMEIDFENSTPIFVSLSTGTSVGAKQDAVGRNTQRLQTVLVIPSGESRVLGGLISRSSSNGKSGIPYLNRLPWIGPLFGNRNETRNSRNLLFFLTPTIVQEEAQIDILEIPVNAAAQQLAEQAQQTESAQPASINPLPDDMKALLREAKPVRLVPGDGETTATMKIRMDSSKPSKVPHVDEPWDAIPIEPAPTKLDFKPVEGVMHDVPLEKPEEARMGISGPGATALSNGASGPTGTMGSGQAKPVSGKKPVKPAPTPAPGAQPIKPGVAGPPGTHQPEVPGGVPVSGQPMPNQTANPTPIQQTPVEATPAPTPPNETNVR